jgi:TolB-like protein
MKQLKHNLPLFSALGGRDAAVSTALAGVFSQKKLRCIKTAWMLFLCSCSLLIVALLITTCGGTPKVIGPDELDIAIRDASDYLNDNIPAGSKIVILNIQSNSDALSNYIIEELIANTVNDRVFTVVDRAQLDAIRAEQNFQWSGEVDDNAALEIGKFFGAQTIVSGALSELGSRHRMTIRALEVQTAQVQGQFNKNINTSETITALMRSPSSAGGSGSGGTATASGGRSQTGTTSGTTAPAAATPAAPTAPARAANGTYTFFPRLQPYQGTSIYRDTYLYKVVVRGEYMSLYITRTPNGNPTPGPWDHGWGKGGTTHTILQDLDNPRRSWSPEYGDLNGFSWGAEGMWWTFKGVTGTRFSCTDSYENPHSIFEEIDLSKAEYEP